MVQTAGSIEWYLGRDGKQYGPVTDEEMRKLVELGHLRASDLVWRQGFAEWQPAYDAFPKPVPPPPPPPPPRQPVPAAGEPTLAPPTGAPSPAIGRAPAAQAAARPAAPQPHPQMAPQSAPVPGPSAIAAPPTERQPLTTPAPSAADTVTIRHDEQQRSPPTRTLPAEPTGRRKPGGRNERKPAGGRDHARGEGRSRSLAATLSIGFIVLIVIGAAGAAAYLYRGQITQLIAGLVRPQVAEPQPPRKSSEVPAAARPVAAAPPTATAPTGAATSTPSAQVPPAAATPAPAPAATTPAVTPTVAEIDANPTWRFVKGEFPEWYGERAREVLRLKSEKQAPAAIGRYMAEALVALRRTHASDALAASPSRLKSIAQAFIDNLIELKRHSVEACYSYISHGEANPTVIELVASQPKAAGMLDRQQLAVFEAVAEGRRQRQTHLPPRRADYDALADELVRRGWNDQDLQTFSDPRLLSRATPDRVCRMVHDWFAAHLAIQDTSIQLRLLVESLRPVVAG